MAGEDTPLLDANEGTVISKPDPWPERKGYVLLTVLLVAFVVVFAAVGAGISVPLLQKRAVIHNVTTYIEDTVYYPLPHAGSVQSLSLKYAKNSDYSSAGEAILLPCTELHPYFSPSVSESDVPKCRDYIHWIYLVEGSVITFTYQPDVDSQNDTVSLWIVQDHELLSEVATKPCSVPFPKKNAECYSFTGPSVRNFTVKTTSYYFYKSFPSSFNQLHWTYDRYSYNFSDYATSRTIFTLTGSEETYIHNIYPTIDLLHFLKEPELCFLFRKTTAVCNTAGMYNILVTVSHTMDITVLVACACGLLTVVAIVAMVSVLVLRFRGWRVCS